jgi:SnoaL-like domain
MTFDQSITWRQIEERLARTTNPRHRMMLQTVIDHAIAESSGDVDGLMATLGDDPRYHFWSNGKDWGPKGREQVRAFYEGFVASGAGFFESSKPRIVVDDDTVVTECVIRGLVPGAIARERGYDVPDVDGHYVVTARTAIFWPFDEAGELVGEDSYGSSDVTDFEQVADEDLPPAYVAMLEAVGLERLRS